MSMKLEAQVCPLYLSRRLKELGVRQESMFYWHADANIANGGFLLVTANDYRMVGPMKYSAFTVAELGEMLPEAFLWDGTTQVGLRCDKYSGGWMVRYQSVSFHRKREIDHHEEACTEAEARSKMLLYLLGSTHYGN